MRESSCHLRWPILILLGVFSTGCRDRNNNPANISTTGQVARTPYSQTNSTVSRHPSGMVPPVEQKPVSFPDLGAVRQLEGGVSFAQATLHQTGHPMQVWVYIPQHKPGQKLPCVLVAPAGSPLIVGKALDEGDRAEQLPYARAGFVVVSYEIDGALPERPKTSEQEILAAASAFKNARGGVLNASTALDFAITKVPEIDPQRIYTAGHSSAATLSLLVASDDPRIKGCIAYAPVTDVEARIGRVLILQLAGAIPGYDEFIKASSPRSQIARLKCPVFLFHARDDSNVPIIESERFVEALKRINPKVTFAVVARGNHYQSMIQQGIPQAIDWLKHLSP